MLGGTVDTSRRELRIGTGKSPLHDSYAGHYATDLRPGMWKALKEAQEYSQTSDDIPKPLRPKQRTSPPKPMQTRAGNLLGALTALMASTCGAGQRPKYPQGMDAGLTQGCGPPVSGCCVACSYQIDATNATHCQKCNRAVCDVCNVDSMCPLCI